MLVLSVLCVWPIIRGGAEGRLNLFEPVTITIFGLFLAYPLRIIVVMLDPDYASQPLYVFSADETLLNVGIVYSIIGIGSYLAFYYYAPKMILRIGNRISLDTKGVTLEWRIVLIFLAGWAFRLYMMMTENFATTSKWSGFDPSTAALLWTCSSLTWFGYILAWVNWFRAPGSNRRALFIALGITAVEGGYHLLFSGSKTFLMYALLFPVIAYSLSREEKRMSGRAVLLSGGFLVLAIIFVFPYIYEYRHAQDIRGQGYSQTVGENYEVMSQSVQSIFSREKPLPSSGENPFMEQVYAFLERWHGFDSLTVFMTEVPENFDYLYGQDLLALPFSLIPRVVFPWKPESSIGGMMFTQILMSGGSSTSPFPIGEGYFNLGVWGIVILMGSLGIAQRWLYSSFYGPRKSEPVATAIYIYLLIFVFANIDSWVLSNYVAFVQRAAVLALACLLFVYRPVHSV